MTDQEIRVRCNHCMSVVYEEYLIKDNGTDSGERCPVCNKSDALMDVSEEGVTRKYKGRTEQPLQPD